MSQTKSKWLNQFYVEKYYDSAMVYHIIKKKGFDYVKIIALTFVYI